MSEEQLAERQPLLSAEDLEHTSVYPTIHMIKEDVIHYIDTPLTYDALTAPDMTYTLVRPLEDKYNALQLEGNKAIVFCFLLNRVHFLRDQNLTTLPLSRSRASLCEILAIRTLRAQGTGDNSLQRTVALTTSWYVYAGADEEVLDMIKADDEDPDDRVGNAIELAIIGNAKRFIKSNAAQRVINSIWSGKCVYQPVSTHSILPDTYKRTPVHFYDPHKAPLLDHYRLKVPAIRSVIEYSNFLILFLLFIWALENNEQGYLNVPEISFTVYAFGFALEKVASMQEHGIKVYFTGMWNGFDLVFVTLFLSYAGLRLYGVFHDSHWARHAGIDVLAVIAVLMFPRLAFVTLKDNLMVLALRAMIVQFMILMLLAAFCFAGFLYALWTLSRNRDQFSAGQIAWWMLDLWFGLDASGFERSTSFHPVFGPALTVFYACLSNTLLLTVMVSILSYTFTTINDDAAAESMFRHAVSTIEGVKSSPVFAFSPPINLVAFVIMLPASYILSPRWFHKLNVFMIRLSNFPLLLGIAWYERQAKRNGTTTVYDTLSAAAEKVFETLPRSIKRLTLFEGLAGSVGDIDAIFEIEDERTCAVSDTEETRSASHPISRNTVDGHTRTSVSKRPPPSMSTSPPAHIPRHRATSLTSRPDAAAQQFLSPLAQVFAIAEDLTSVVDQHTDADDPISSGIAARKRRLSTAHRRAGSGAAAQRAAFEPGSLLFPPARAGRRNTSGSSHPLAASPENTAAPIETAAQVEEEEGDGVGELHGSNSMMWTRRLDAIESRQRRMESLLEQIVKGLQA